MFSIINRFFYNLIDIIRNIFFHISHVIVVPLRYNIEVKNRKFLESQFKNKKKGILFLANHSSNIDGTILTTALVKLGHPISVWALDLTFKLPYLRWAARHSKTVKVVKVPNINEVRSEKHLSRLHKLVTRTADGLRRGSDFLIFPSGRSKLTPIEKIDGKSAVPQIIRQCPEVNIVLVRVTGLWGSRFSLATKRNNQWRNETIRWADLLWQAIKMIVLNGIFFIPKRKVVIEFLPVGDNFPRFGSRLEINRYLEERFNEAWGPQGEPLYRVPDYFWKSQTTEHEYQTKHYQFNLNSVPRTIRNDIVKKIADKADLDCKDIDFNMSLGRDLGFDSLDVLEVLIELEKTYKIKKFVPEDVSTVGHLIAIAAKIPIVCEIKKGEFSQIDHHQTVLSKYWKHLVQLSTKLLNL